MSPIDDHVRPAVRELKPYQPGKPIEEVQRELGIPRVVKLASNEYPEGPFPEVIEALERELAGVSRYPDPGCYDLGRAVAEVLGVTPEELFFGNGNNEILELLVHLFCGPGDKVVYGHPSFPIYRLVCQSHFDSGVPVPLDREQVHDLDAMLAAVDENTRVVFVCNPNNPTGTYVGHDALARFLEKVPEDVVVALDEAYHEFVVAKDYPDFFALRDAHPNLIALRTFSKAYSLAGLRVGYAIATPEMVSLLHRVRQPFNVNRLAQIAATEAIRHQDRVRERRVDNRRRLDVLARGLQELNCRVIPSQTNFVLAEAPGSGMEIFERLLHEGVIVRPMGGFALGERSFRVNAGTDEENEFFLSALARVLASENGS